MNNYNNYGYMQYPYTNFQPQQQTTYHPLTFVNGIEGAKAFIVSPNQTVYLKDSDSNLLYEKKADYNGRYTIIAYEMKEIDLNAPKQPEPNKEYITRGELEQLKDDFAARIGKISELLEKGEK